MKWTVTRLLHLQIVLVVANHISPISCDHIDRYSDIQMLLCRQHPLVRTCLGINPLLASISKGTAWHLCQWLVKATQTGSLKSFLLYNHADRSLWFRLNFIQTTGMAASHINVTWILLQNCISIVCTLVKIQLFGLKISSLVSALSAESCQRAQTGTWKSKQWISEESAPSTFVFANVIIW